MPERCDTPGTGCSSLSELFDLMFGPAVPKKFAFSSFYSSRGVAWGGGGGEVIVFLGVIAV